MRHVSKLLNLFKQKKNKRQSIRLCIQKNSKKKKQCPNKHKLISKSKIMLILKKPQTYMNGIYCDKCNKEIKKSNIMNCLICCFDLCDNCFNKMTN